MDVTSQPPGVINSVMPKGVEHDELLQEAAEIRAVINSVMPKGVEHKIHILNN